MKKSLTLLSGAALMFAVACNSNSGSNTVKPSGAQLVGAGSTFVYPVMTRWIDQFHQKDASVQINYQSIGSGGGIQQLKKGLVDFGASDAALDDNQLKEMQPVIQIPESAGPVCITYNLPELKKPLRLTPEALSGIFLGTIKKWTDPQITKANPSEKLPDKDILVAHRSDGSGTTNIFTTYLATVNPDWSKKVGKGISVNWPVGLGGKGSEGVTGVIKQSEGAIGYVELTYAEENHLPVAEVKNKAGQFVAPTADGTTAAMAANVKTLAADVRTPIVDPPATARDAYPISGFTFLLVPKDGKDQAKRAQLKKFIEYIISDGQDVAGKLHYAKLPQSIIDLDQEALKQMTANGQPLQ